VIDLDQLLTTALRAAESAGQMIARSRPKRVERKAGGESLASQVLTDIDEQSQQIILDTLSPTLERFDLALLTEEREDDGSRFEKEFFWCVDPLDGTLPFIDNIPGYAVSIALVSRNGTPQIGVIYDPVEHNSYHAIRGKGIYLNGKPWRAPQRSQDALRLIADRSLKDHPQFSDIVIKLEQTATELGLPNGVETNLTGGAAMNAIWVLENPPACYFKPPKTGKGGGSLWDYAATACLFTEAGAIATDFSGEPLDLNRADSTFMNHRGILYATDADLAHRITRSQ
jgi:fructose-1,6-bisphosphatase/inositol monophosphatase family enzyme